MQINVNGIVQGVGFRPFIHKLVKDYGLNGWVKNASTGVFIEVEGNIQMLLKFVDDIGLKHPKLSVIEKITYEIFDDIKNYESFKIIKSTESEEKFTLISPDVCTCEDCLSELFDKSNKRYRFPFINCTNCGPRFTIIKDIPYDRHKTTMSVFPMCGDCKSEYEDIEDRRYHAQPDCCFECGPELYFTDNSGRKIEGDPIEIARQYIIEGKIIAIKGLGGFHLSCDAGNKGAIKELRVRKHRDEKPFALMCRNIEIVGKWCNVSAEEKDILEGFRRPIVLLRKREDKYEVISPDNDYLGIMLPYTPVHFLLLEKNIDTIIMTSGNISDEPIIIDNDDALGRLGDVADGFLFNNREIFTRCDDSLIRIFDGREYPIRRSRGYTPFPIKVDKPQEQILACGAEQKASFALARDIYVFPSQHIGDMKNMETLDNYERQIKHFERLFDIKPMKIACDLHPDYLSTNYALDRGRRDNVPVYLVQHHHAHMASCMADNNVYHDVIGIVWDGTGYGDNGEIWGGEFFIGGYSGYSRVASIKPIPLPGGDKAIKDIKRIACSMLYETFGEIPEGYIKTMELPTIVSMLESNINCPRASSIGRLFDGIASLTGIKEYASYEGQGAIAIEYEATDCDSYYNYDIVDENGLLVFDWRPMIKDLIRDIDLKIDRGIISGKFMNTLICMSVSIARNVSERYHLRDIVLSGGVFQNIYLLSKMKKSLEEAGLNVFLHNRVPTNDEGISLGQLLIVTNGGEVKCV